MKGGGVRAWAAVLAAASIVPASGSAQTVFAGGAAALPLGAFADVADAGYQVFVGGTVDVGRRPTVVGVRAFYGRNGHEIEGEWSELYGLSVLGGYRLMETPGLRLTAWGGIGGAVHAGSSETYPGLDRSRGGLTVSGGVTVSREVAAVRAVGSVLYTRGLGRLGSRNYPTELATIGASLAIPLGSD